METKELIRECAEVAERIEATAPERQHLFHFEFHAILQRMKAKGIEIPAQARALDERLGDAAFEAEHENMPL
ncbi:hypothetical protein [Rhodalgimonas zhirmunskyi]|uniref:Uncharacterized protein n=1 Tax=Rhodalgimonas zhirmunskyi TaxID=2964767 RepID=A0AAJ1U816_9RHOB|nr:hypothetical protein [Rhodoalgimonas zhirmunskyi]MDQ2095305.1 hypothetical protein [Rhodoalgimonas zhirmunskyi]